jgi:putative transposase
MLRAYRISERRSCRLVPITRSSLRYEARPCADAELVGELRAIAHRYPRFGYRRAHALVRRAGQRVNHKRVARLWRINDLALPRRRPRKRYKVERLVPINQATRPNEVWTYDFVHDACANGQRLKMLTVVDEFTRESLTVETRTSIKSRAVVEVLERLTGERGAPTYLRSDNGPEFVAGRVREWLAAKQISTLYIEPGSPWQNARGESFNGRLRDECLNVEWFNNLREAQVVIESWRQHYNEERPHSSLQYQTPIEFRLAHQQSQNGFAHMRI